MENQQEIDQITRLLNQQADAIRRRDIAAATRNYAEDVLVFDVVGPLAQPRGLHSVQERLKQWLSGFQGNAPIQFEITALEVFADGSLAFSHAFNHVNATLEKGGSLEMYWRESLHWQKIGGEWKIVHAHSSVPFDAGTGKASIGLRPLAGR